MQCGEDYFLSEKEKNEKVSGKFLYAVTDFSIFKKDEAYWLEYIGNDTYVGRSDNILNQKFHITPRQLFTLFSQELEEVQGPPQEEKQVSLNYEHPFDENPSDNEIIEALIKHLKEQDGFLTAIDCVSTKAILRWLEKQKEQKPEERFEEAREKYQVEWSDNDDQLIGFIFDLLNDLAWRKDWAMSKEECLERLKSIHPQPKQEWSEEDEKMRVNILNALTPQLVYSVGKGTCTGTSTYKYDDEIKWLKSLRPVSKESLQPHWKPCEEQIHAIIEALKYLPNNKDEWMVLNTLVDDLKKLM